MMFGLPYKLIGIGAAALLLIFWAMFTIGQAKQIGTLKSQLDAAIEIANNNAAIHDEALAKVKADHLVELAAAKAKAKNRQLADQRRKEINDAPITDDGPVAPVLRRTLDQLRGQQGDPGVGPGTAASNKPDLAGAMSGAVGAWSIGDAASRRFDNRGLSGSAGELQR